MRTVCGRRATTRHALRRDQSSVQKGRMLDSLLFLARASVSAGYDALYARPAAPMNFSLRSEVSICSCEAKVLPKSSLVTRASEAWCSGVLLAS